MDRLPLRRTAAARVLCRIERRVGITALGAAAACLGACGGTEPAASAGPTRVVEAFGRAVTVAERPARIVPASASALDVLGALVGPERVAGIPETALVYTDAAGAAGWEGVPTFARYTAEAVLALDPDLVLTHGWQSADTTELLRGQGVPVVSLPDVRSLADVMETVRVVARLVGEPRAGAALVADLERRVAALAERAPAEPPAVLSYTNFGSGGWTAGRGTTVDVALGLAGLRNAAAEMGIEGHGELDVERLLALDPDWILVSASDDATEYAPSERYLREEPALRELGALLAGRVLRLPGALFSSGSQRVVEAAERLAAELERGR